MYVRRVRTVKLLKFGNSVCIESFGTISIYIYILYSNRWWNLSTKLVNFVTRRNNLTLDSTTIAGDSLPLPLPSWNIVYVILQTWNLGASFSICGKLRFIDFPPPFIFPSLPGLPSFPPSSFSRVHPENSTLDHGYSTVASFLSTAHSAKSRLSVLFGRRVMLVILRIDRFSSHDRVEFAIRNVPFFLPPPLLLLSLSLWLLANRWKRNRLCGKEKLHYISDEFEGARKNAIRYYFRKFSTRRFLYSWLGAI